jgi:hypothetical protein
MKKNSKTTDTINSLEQFLDLVESYKTTYYFRGQANHKYNINPGISRDLGWMQYEYSMIEEMYQKNRSEFKADQISIVDLFKMQHYGLPTRLCDITKSPVIALYFALDNLNDNNIDAKVFVINQMKTAKLDDFAVQSILMLAYKSIPDINTLQIDYNSMRATSFNSDDFINAVTHDYIIEPEYEMQNNRSFVQEGTSILFGFDVDENGIVLRQNRRSLPSSYIHKEIIIPANYKETILQELDDRYAINKNNILLSIESVADAIKYSNKSIHPDTHISGYTWKDEVKGTISLKKVFIEINLKKSRTKTEIRRIIQVVNYNILRKYRITPAELKDNVTIYGYVYQNDFYQLHHLNSCRTYMGKPTITFSHNDQVAGILIDWNYDNEIWGIHKVNSETSAALLMESTVSLADESIHIFDQLASTTSEYLEGTIDMPTFIANIKDLKKQNFALIFKADEIPHGNERTIDLYEDGYKLLHNIDNLCNSTLLNMEHAKADYTMHIYSKEVESVKLSIIKYRQDYAALTNILNIK